MIPAQLFEQYIAYGLSVIPTDHEKRPLLSTWRKYMEAFASKEDCQGFGGAYGIGVVCGGASFGLCCVDVDTKNDEAGTLIQDFGAMLENNAPGILVRLICESTVNGGRHLIFRTAIEVKTEDLAMSEVGKVLIETRGEGAYFVAAPTEGYILKAGSFAAIPTLTDEETLCVLSCARALNRKVYEPVKFSTPPKKEGGITPFDDFDCKTPLAEVAGWLEAKGWRITHRQQDIFSLRRPGKDRGPLSATLGRVPGRFFVFSTSTEFESRKTYKPCAVYTMLFHSGDFHAAAKDLYQKGFGDRLTKEEKKPALEIKGPEKFIPDLDVIYERGIPPGLSTGWESLDEIYRVKRGSVHVITGIPTHGKSEFLDSLLVNMARLHNLRTLYFSAENQPVTMHMMKIVEKVIGKPMLPGGRMSVPKMSREDFEAAKAFIMDRFTFMDLGEDSFSIDAVLAQAEKISVDVLVIDPWNELEHARDKAFSESEYIGLCLQRVRKFARARNLILFIVAHPHMMRKDKDGNYPVPTMYDISGSAHWYNKSDFGISIWRNFAEGSTTFNLQRSRDRFYATNGEVKFKYELSCGRFNPWTAAEDFRVPERNFDNQLPTGDRQ